MLMTGGLLAQSRLEFRLYAPSLPDTASVYISGNANEIGAWAPNRVRLQSMGRGNWTLSVKVDAGQELEYKYTLGSWARESLDRNGQVRGNWKVRVGSSAVVSDTVLLWKTEAAPRKVQGGVTGTVQYLRNIQPQGLAARDIVVWLPPGYLPGAKKRYPVLYMHDGQNIVDPATSSFGVDWRIDETCDSLMRAGKIPQMIVVGVNNSGDRREEYSPGEKGTLYMDFLTHQLKPKIDSMYPTLPDRKHTYCGGSSMGGLISMMLVWEHPETFSKAICMSPAFQYKGFDYVAKVTENPAIHPKIKVYMDNGGVGLETVLQPGCEAMLKALDGQGYKRGKDYFWVNDVTANHFESDWARRMPAALVWLLGR
jgi:enterochelin esterase-like enzyme